MKLSEISSAPASALVAFYNEKSGKPAIKKFADRKTAEKRVAALIESLPAPKVEKTETAPAPKKSAPKSHVPSIGERYRLENKAEVLLVKEDGPGFFEVEVYKAPKGSGYKAGEIISLPIKDLVELNGHRGFERVTAKEGTTSAPAPKAPAKPKKEGSTSDSGESNRKGRKSAYSGKTIRRATEKGANPRREGTWGYKSFELIPKDSGIEYDAYIKAGGRNNDFLWDLARGFVTVG